MSLIVETGQGAAGSESYVSAADCTAYHDRLGNVMFGELSEELQEQALRRAMIFMKQAYRQRWAGSRVTRTQALDWPRAGVCVEDFPVLSDEVPEEVVEACCELALRAAAGELLPDLEIGTNQIKKDKTGPLETEFFENNVTAVGRFPGIDALLAPYFGATGGSGMMTVTRA